MSNRILLLGASLSLSLSIAACGGDDSKKGDEASPDGGDECAAESCGSKGGGNIVLGCSTFKDRDGQKVTVAITDGTQVVFEETDSVGSGTGDCRFTFNGADPAKSYGLQFYVDVDGDGACGAGDYVVKMADVNLGMLMTNDITIGIGESYPAGDCSVF